MNENPTVARQEAEAVLLDIGVQRAGLAIRGQSSPMLDDLAVRAEAALVAAANAENEAMVAAMQTLDPDEFGQRVRLRRRMDALRKKRATSR
jgi:hypothetical protein